MARSDEADARLESALDATRRWWFGLSAHKHTIEVVDFLCLGYASPNEKHKGRRCYARIFR